MLGKELKHRGYNSLQVVFCKNRQFSWKMAIFIWKLVVFMKTGSFHDILIGLSYVYMKDIYLVITLNLINLHVKSAALFTFYCAFHWKALHFSLKSSVFFTALFMKALHFSLKSTKSTALFTFRCTFHWKAPCFSMKSTKTTDSTQISQFDLVFHRVQR